jgi:bifunctional non-homologous end joining protein LigD
MLATLSKEVRSLQQDDPPVSRIAGLPRKGIHWVRPELVAQVGFSEWTPDGKLRHPRYLGLRDDKESGDVVREGA